MWNWNVFLLRYICYFNVAFVNKIILRKEPYCSYDDTVFTSGYWHVFDLSNWFSLNPVQNTQGSFMSLLCKEHLQWGHGSCVLAISLRSCKKVVSLCGLACSVPSGMLSMSVFHQTLLQIQVLPLSLSYPSTAVCLPSLANGMWQ